MCRPNQLQSQKTTKNLKNSFFYIQWFLIGLISSYDTYLTILYQQTLVRLEENPLARQILEWDNWNVGVFIGLKMAGTILALGFLFIFHNHFPKLCHYVILPITIFQLFLLYYLEYGNG